MAHYVVYSHGFGVERTGRGLFTDIAVALPNATHVMFDYNDSNPDVNEMTVSSFDEQVRRLYEQLKKIDTKNNTVDIVAHSQGCVVAALAQPENIRTIICIAPPASVDPNQTIARFSQRAGAEMHIEGISIIPRRDGSTTLIPAVYWESARNIDAIESYNKMAQKAQKVVFVIANNDEVLGVTNFEQAGEKIELVQLDGDHDFTSSYRQPLVGLLKTNLSK